MGTSSDPSVPVGSGDGLNTSIGGKIMVEQALFAAQNSLHTS